MQPAASLADSRSHHGELGSGGSESAAPGPRPATRQPAVRFPWRKHSEDERKLSTKEGGATGGERDAAEPPKRPLGPSIRSVHFAWGLTTQGIWGQFLSCPMRHTHTQVSSPATSRHPPPNRPGKTGISLSPLSTPEC